VENESLVCERKGKYLENLSQHFKFLLGLNPSNLLQTNLEGKLEHRYLGTNTHPKSNKWHSFSHITSWKGR